jgi:uncharacterized protein YozE (UPF0346 family)
MGIFEQSGHYVMRFSSLVEHHATYAAALTAYEEYWEALFAVRRQATGGTA